MYCTGINKGCETRKNEINQTFDDLLVTPALIQLLTSGLPAVHAAAGVHVDPLLLHRPHALEEEQHAEQRSGNVDKCNYTTRSYRRFETRFC